MAKRDKEWERFRVIRELGKGAFGRTFLVSDATKDDEQIVIKVPHDKKTEEALINELMQASALAANLVGMTHPNIVRFLGFGRFEGFYVMMLEYVQGCDLREIIGPMQITRRPMSIKRAVEIVTNICSGLAIAHRINLLHRDIKPDNILVRQDDDVPKLLDFGISKIMQSSGVGSGTVVGTFPYMAPEALTGHTCMASDTWSLTVTLYELITGHLPFWEENVFALKYKIDTANPVPPREFNPEVDEQLSALVMHGLDKDPKKRFQTAQNMFEALSRLRLVEEIANLRQLFFQEGKEDEAEKQAYKLLERIEEEPTIYMLIAEFCNRRQQFLQAEDIVRQGIKVCPDHAGLHFYLAPALWNQGHKKRQLAVDAMQRALQLGLTKVQERQARNLLRSWKGAGGGSL